MGAGSSWKREMFHHWMIRCSSRRPLYRVAVTVPSEGTHRAEPGKKNKFRPYKITVFLRHLSAGLLVSGPVLKHLSVEVSVLILVQDWNKYRYRYLITSIYKHQYCPSLVKPSVTHTHTQLQREHTLSFSLL